MVVKTKRYTKDCPDCGTEQSYGRKDHYNSAVRNNWKCKSCSNSSNNFAGKVGPMPVTWFNTKMRGGMGRGYQWDITPEYIISMYEQQGGLCAITGWTIGWSEKGLTATVSIDRIDSEEGYIQGNVQLLHKDVNMAKQQYSQDYFIAMCRAVADKAKW